MSKRQGMRTGRAGWIAQLLGCGASLAVIAVATPALAQVAADAGSPAQNDASATAPAAASSDSADDIVITGIRASLANAQDLKRDADTVVDAITAQDIGALPDRSVTEALQRVPGVSVTRFAAGSDPDHFSVEGSGVVIRGLNYVRSEFNGRDTFSANGGRALNFADVSPELLGSVEVYKNMTADQIEGGIAGSVNLNTRKPFDSKESLFYLSADMNYGDFAKKGGPAVSGLVTRNFDTSIGRFGVLAGASYSQLFSRADGLQVTNYQARFNGSRDINGDGVNETDTFPGLAAGQLVYAPVGAGARTQQFNRERFGAAAALQFESNDKSLLATLQFVRSDGKQTWGERTVETAPDSIDRLTFPRTGTNFTFGPDGLFNSGIISIDRGYVPNGGQQRGMITQLSNRGVQGRAITNDFGGNVKWQANDRLSFAFDGQYVESTTKQTDFSVYGATFADVQLDVTGGTPDIRFLAPNGQDSAAYFADPRNSYYRAAMDHFEDNKGHEWAFRGDATYEFDDASFLKRAKVGARYADRDQTVRYSLYNWGVLSETWSGSGPVTFADVPGNTGYFTFDNLYRGNGPAGLAAYYIQGNPAADYAQASAQAVAVNQFWQTQKGANAGGFIPAGQRSGVISGTPFLPNEVYTNSEETKAAYARVDFGTQGTDMLGGLQLSGNVGLRYVQTTDDANGFTTFPRTGQIIGSDTGTVAAYCGNPSQTSPFCRLSTAEQNAILAFSNGAAVNQVTRNRFDHWLPSFNMKVGLARNLISRFAYSKAISRPRFDQLQGTVQIAPATGISAFRLDGTTRDSNPLLRPVEANQFDFTTEWYFARVGTLTAALFYKDLTNVIVANVAQSRAITNNGVTQTINYVGPQNADGHSNVKGFEVSYQQTYDFLPGWLSGLGVQANYTYVDPSNIPQGRAATAQSTTTTIDVSRLPLEGLSKHTVNATVFYERGPVSLRAAYNWRSKYVLTVRDEIAPFLPIYSGAYGQLDGTFLYTINNQFKIGIQAVNLLDSVTKTYSVINAEGQLAPRSYFKNDRRFALTTRIQF